MKNEIKEILEYIQKYTDEYETTNLTEIRALQIGYVDTVLLLDYITNLQNENMKYDQCLTELTDNYKELQKELTNLQEENKRLKELCDKYEEEHNTTFKLWTMKIEDIPTYEEKKELQNRIDKAIQYIKEKSEEVELNFYGFPDKITSFRGSVAVLLNILQGKSDE